MPVSPTLVGGTLLGTHLAAMCLEWSKFLTADCFDARFLSGVVPLEECGSSSSYTASGSSELLPVFIYIALGARGSEECGEDAAAPPSSAFYCSCLCSLQFWLPNVFLTCPSSPSPSQLRQYPPL